MPSGDLEGIIMKKGQCHFALIKGRIVYFGHLLENMDQLLQALFTRWIKSCLRS